MFRTFTRTWWKDNPNWPNGLEPEAGEKTYHEEFETLGEARSCCMEYNEANDPGRYSLKMEFES